MIKGNIRERESPGSKQESLSMFWTEPITQIALNSRNNWHEVSLLAVDKYEAAAQSDFDAAKDVVLRRGKYWVNLMTFP